MTLGEFNIKTHIKYFLYTQFHVIIITMKKGILFLVLVMLALLWTNVAIASELTNDYYDIAANYYNSNNYTKALEYLDFILNLEPDNIAAKALKDKILPPGVNVSNEPEQHTQDSIILQTPENTVILEAPQTNVEKVPYDSNYYNSKGQEFFNKKEYDTAIEYFYKAIAINKKNAQAYNNLAMSYWLKNNTYAAIKYFKRANLVNHNYTQPFVNLAMLYKQLGDKKSQVYYLERAIKSNPSDYLAYYWLGDYYRNKGAYPAAIQNYKEVVKINPKFSQVYLNLAICFFETEEFNYTLLALSQYREFCPNSDFDFFLAARAALALCHYDDAKIYIEKAISICDKSEYQYELAKIDYCLEDYQTALGILQNLLNAGDSAEIFNYIGLCNYKLKNIDAAIENFNKAINIDGLRPIYYYNLAQCYKSLGDKKNYVKYINTATKITPINYQDFIDLSYIYYDSGNSGYAINSLNSAITRYPDVKSLYLSKLKIYEALGDNLHYNETKNLIEMRFNKR